uniref:hypothetical protein n=1 Tax=Xenorhabdus sp. GDc328 TaxID=742178 RepID=UPI001F2AF289
SISALRLRSVRFGLHKFSLVNYNALSVSDARSRSFEANLLTDILHNCQRYIAFVRRGVTELYAVLGLDC